MRYISSSVAVFALLVGSVAVGGVVDFDSDTSGNAIVAPELFINAVALSELYAPSGVHFTGPGGKDGGAILKVGGGSLGPAHSAPNFLAFNTSAVLADGGIPRGPVNIAFDTPVRDLSIYAGVSFGNNGFTLDAYDAGGALVASDSATPSSSFAWEQLAASWPAGIARVTLTASGDGNYLYDDLSFTPVPEPGAAILLLSALLALAARRGRKQSGR